MPQKHLKIPFWGAHSNKYITFEKNVYNVSKIRYALEAALITCEDYLVLRDDFIVFNTECNQRYIRNRLAMLRSEIELLFYQQYKNVYNNPEV